MILSGIGYYKLRMGVKKSGTVCFVSGLSEFIPLVSVFIPSLSISIPSKGKNWLKNVLDFCTGLVFVFVRIYILNDISHLL